MPDSALSELWLAAIIVRGLCLLTWRTARPWWLAWALFSEAMAIWLRYLDFTSNAVYAKWWIAEQLINAPLLVLVTWEACSPPVALIVASATAALLVGAALPPNRTGIAMVMWGCGVILLACGIAATTTAINDRRPAQAVLAVYLVCSCLLLLAGQDLLNQAGLGRAWSLLEVLALLGWMGIGIGRRREAQ